ncbi:MAG: M20/M25/M40 family metallo-hydrolase [Candidatus Bathyarchaeota archaeon]|nr:M20/M25/M40 family metallo-hydrolase [Candidatus Bathyarchaeota archaeon]
MNSLRSRIVDWVEEHRDEYVEFLQEVLSIPSPSFEETRIAEFLAGKMMEYGYDTVLVDEKSDALGTIKGVGGGRSFLLNGHIDHVPVGQMVDPYSGRLMDGAEFGTEGEVVYGRAACDMKASVAAMVLAGKLLKDMGVKLNGDYKVAAVAQEEVGGAGTMSSIIDHQFLADIVLIGEATDMELALGHRGSLKFEVVVKGRACHASAPERGINALYKAMKMIRRIQLDLIPRLPEDPIYGKVSLAVTQIEVSPKASNVVPEECKFVIDCRNTPEFSAEVLYEELNGIIAELKESDPEFEAMVLPSSLIMGRRFSGFYTDPEEYPVVGEVVETISEVYRTPAQGVWSFATDGRIYSRLGIPVVGFGPGEEKFAHTQMDHVKVRDYLDTVKVYAWLACRICGVSEN